METRSFSRSVAYAMSLLPQRALFAYCVNLDAVFRVAMPGAKRLWHILPELERRMMRGQGGEVVISRGAYRRIERLLQKPSLRIGAQAGNMALDASRLGVISYLHAPNRSRKMLRLFPPAVLVACRKSFSPACNCGDGSAPPIHLVLEYRKSKTIPASNRFIVSYEAETPSLRGDGRFSRNIKNELPEIMRGFVSGFHLAPPPVLRRKRQRLVSQIRGWRRLNPGLRLHLEWGCFSSSETERLVAKYVLPEVDSVGFNEEELCSLLHTLNTQDIAPILSKTRTVLLHAQNYSMACSREFEKDSLARSLAFASCAAGFKASRGRSPTRKELLRAKFNPKKATIPKEALSLFPRNGTAFSPSASITPKHTLGLGDCFSMAFFLTLG